MWAIRKIGDAAAEESNPEPPLRTIGSQNARMIVMSNSDHCTCRTSF